MKLTNLAKQIKKHSLQALFAADPQRSKTFSLDQGPFFFDYSKNFIDSAVMEALKQWAMDHHLPEAVEGLFKGEIFNRSENRASLHMDCRSKNPKPVVAKERLKMANFIDQLNGGQWLGASGKPITDVVNIGIGGSDLGPVLTTQALEAYKLSPLNFHFISNIDPWPLEKIFLTLDPATTLFILSSKTLSTIETQMNGLAAMEWLRSHFSAVNAVDAVDAVNAVDPVARHFIAITAAPKKAIALGILPEHILTFWDWVGGRYSIWSAIGFPLALSLGMPQFEDFLQGAFEMDQHFQQAPIEKNLPMLFALIGIWNINFLGAKTQAILPYDYRLRCFVDYIQQLDMESNGKSVQQNNEPTADTGPIIWGQMGTNGQHAFYQLLHQGTHHIAIDFLLTINRETRLKSHSDALIANCLAQAQALMIGKEDAQPQQSMPGNKSSNLLIIKHLDPKSLGALIALYEHKIFCQGVLWNINSFDQPGVELGKKIASEVSQVLADVNTPSHLHESTYDLIREIHKIKKN